MFLASDGAIPDQPDHLAFATVGASPGPLWEGRRAGRDAYDAVGAWEALAAALGLSYRISQSVEPAFHPGRAGRILVDDEVIGVVGEIHHRHSERLRALGLSS